MGPAAEFCRPQAATNRHRLLLRDPYKSDDHRSRQGTLADTGLTIRRVSSARRQSTGVAIALSSARRPRTKSRNAGIQIGEPTNNAPRRPHGPAPEMNMEKIQIVNPDKHRATAHANPPKK